MRFVSMFRLAALGLLMLLAAPAKAQIAAARLPENFFGDPSGYGALLKQYVDENGRVDYAALKSDRAPLDAFLAQAAKLPEHRVHAFWAGDSDNVKALRASQQAFFINVYNARVLQSILDRYPLKDLPRTDQTATTNSVLQIPGFFDAEKFTVAGVAMTLDEVSSNVLMGQFRDPVQLFALARGAKSSAPLRSEAYVGERLGAQIKDQDAKTMAMPSGFVNGAEARKLLPMFLRDFFGPGDVVPGKPLPAAAAQPFDWTLNDQAEK